MANGESRRVIVIGGGISGLSTAFWLHDAGIDVTVLEASPRVGGVIRTERFDGYLCELGPNSTLDASPLLSKLFEKAGVIDQRIYANPAAKRRFILREGRLRQLPMSPPALFKSDLFTWRAKLRVLREPFVDANPYADNETVSQFVRRRLGQEFLDYVINPFVSGVYAGNPDELSIRDAFFKVYALERDYGSLIKGAIKKRKERKAQAGQNKMTASLLSFRDGMAVLPETIARRLGDRVVTSATVRQITGDDGAFEITCERNGTITALSAAAVILAVPTSAAAELLTPFSTEAAENLRQIPYAPVAVVFQGYRRESCPHPLQGFGFLVPAVERRDILGTIWSSSLFEGRAPDGHVALTTFVGGRRRPDLVELSEEELNRLVTDELRQLLGVTDGPVVYRVRRWPRAIPQYTLGHAERLAPVEQVEDDHPGLFVSGNFRGGISVGDCIVQSHEVAQRVMQYLEHPKPAEVAAE
jgi:oxygen-dependent protoporphyrinogen oxidase